VAQKPQRETIAQQASQVQRALAMVPLSIPPKRKGTIRNDLPAPPVAHGRGYSLREGRAVIPSGPDLSVTAKKRYASADSGQPRIFFTIGTTFGCGWTMFQSGPRVSRTQRASPRCSDAGHCPADAADLVPEGALSDIRVDASM
jgi:hypothetical protein